MKAAFRNFVLFGIFMTVSVKNILTLIVMSAALTACGKEEKELSPAEINAKADSIVQSRAEKMRREAKEDLDKRLPIEIKPKIDSIRNQNNAIDPVPVFPDNEAGDDAIDDPGMQPLPEQKDSAKK
jgi:predicted small lipoprotein YifL